MRQCWREYVDLLTWRFRPRPDRHNIVCLFGTVLISLCFAQHGDAERGNPAGRLRALARCSPDGDPYDTPAAARYSVDGHGYGTGAADSLWLRESAWWCRIMTFCADERQAYAAATARRHH